MKQARTRAMVSLTVLLACCACAFALDPSLDITQYAHTSWKIRDGFTKGWISSIAQTPDGYVWLGTEFGLYRFDGVRAVPWQPPGNVHLPAGSIFSLLVSRDGALWIGTKGLANWKEGKVTRFPELDGEGIYTLFEDREGTVWVGAGGAPRSGKLCAIRSGSMDCFGGDGQLGFGVVCLYEDRNGNLWVGVKDGLWRWKPGPPKFYPLPDEPDGIQAVAEDVDGALLVGWKSGVYRFVEGKTQPFPVGSVLHQFRAHKMLRDRNGALWIGTIGNGLLHIHHGRTDVLSPSDDPTSESIYTFFEDREGNVWVSTTGALNRFHGFAAATLTVKQGITRSTVLSVLADRDGGVWLATRNGLNRWDHGQVTIPKIGGGAQDGKINGSAPTSLFQDNRRRIWLSTNREVGYLENGRFTSIKGVPAEGVLSITQDRATNLWLISEPVGLVRISPQNDIQQILWSELGHKDNATVLTADQGSGGGLWIGFFRGGIVYFSGGQIRASYTAADGLGTGRVSDFYFDNDGTLWISTEGGLSRLKNDHIATLTSKNGLPCDAVHWVIEDNHQSLWLYMACGLVRIDRSELAAWAAAAEKRQDAALPVRVTVFDNSDGVRSLSIPGHCHPQVAKTPDGKLWFLPWDGVSVIDPRHLHINKFPPPVHIEQIAADGEVYDTSTRLRLPPRVQHIDIDYTALSLVAPEKNRFRFMLEGYDRDWQDVGNRRQAFYTNLPPRNYRFRVVASNNSGVWNEEGASLEFDIPPAWYQTLWFRAACVAAFLLLFWSAHLLRVRHLRRQEKKLRDVVETMPTFAWTALPDGSVDFVNRHWQEFTGLSTEKTVGSGWESAVHSADVKRHVEKWRASLATGEPFENEVRYRQGEDGQYRWFLARAVPLRDGKGNIVKWYGVSTDIEDRKRAEQEREKLREDLAHVNRVSMLGELSASLSHELKQPITAAVISANTTLEWLNRKQPDVENARESTATIVTAGMRAAEIIDRLRSLYKKTPPQRQLLDVNEIVGEMITLLRSEGNSYAISMRAELAPDLPQVMADRVQLQQVLMNLMLNAIEAMKETGGVLTIKSQPQDGHVIVSVSDTGVGLPPEKAERIFDAFFTTKPQGSGMGLAISRSIIESHGGRLWATPNNGRGASFHFTLPTTSTAGEAPARTS